MTISNRLDEAMKRAGHRSQMDLQRASGVPQPTINRILKGKGSKGPEAETVKKLAAACNVTFDWLNEGRGEMARGSQSIETLSNVYSLAKKAQKTVSITQFRGVGGSMGNGVILRDQPGAIESWDVTPEWVNKNIKSHSGIANLCVVTGFGPSMQPLYNPGDPLIIDRGIKTVDSDAIYFFRVDNEGFIKLLQRIPGVGIRVISKNKDFETWTITPDMDFEVFGQVLKAWSGTDV